ncbi:MAG: hypothetical protein D6781_03170, partial [Verrucomicrobia bacterium]
MLPHRLRRFARVLPLLFFLHHAAAQAPVADPVAPIEPGDLTIEITLFAQLPASAGSPPLARINHVKPAGDGSGRLFANDLRGRLFRVFEGGAAVYLDLKAEVGAAFRDAPGLGTGFTSFAFHPNFATNGKFYTAHSEAAGSGVADFTMPNPADAPALQGVIVEWKAADPVADAFSGTHRELLRVDLSGTIHGMQEIAFNPNAEPGGPDYGMLYVCIGDGGSTIGGFPENTSRLDSLLGTILRIEPLGTNSANGAYGISPDNPWAADGDPLTFGEIWAYGFRNPHRISWDTGGDGKMLEGDIGERNIEEINLILPGRHYGWNVREGTFRINPRFAIDPSDGAREEIFPLPADDASLGYTYPVAQYDHDDGRAVVGGYVYRGRLAPALVGKYLFGDLRSGRLFVLDAGRLELGRQEPIEEVYLELDGVPRTMLDIVDDSRVDMRFGYDEDGELFITEKRAGRIFRVVGARQAGASGGAPTTRLVNISTRGLVGEGDEVLVAGFVVGGGDAGASVLIRGVGPTLADMTEAAVVADPVVEVYRAQLDGSSVRIATNDDWEDDPVLAEAAATSGAFPLM